MRSGRVHFLQAEIKETEKFKGSMDLQCVTEDIYLGIFPFRRLLLMSRDILVKQLGGGLLLENKTK